jgi:hypothetical protein
VSGALKTLRPRRGIEQFLPPRRRWELIKPESRFRSDPGIQSALPPSVVDRAQGNRLVQGGGGVGKGPFVRFDVIFPGAAVRVAPGRYPGSLAQSRTQRPPSDGLEAFSELGEGLCHGRTQLL